MQKFKSFDEILSFAILREEEAYDFYQALAAKMERTEIQKVFRSFAQEELGHKKKLEAVKRGEYTFPVPASVTDMKIADYSVDDTPAPDIDYQDALILAMKKEKAAFRLYTDLARGSDDPAATELFLGLAQEEAKHKLRFEVEYDDYVMKEN
jgi:rubrerythrin